MSKHYPQPDSLNFPSIASEILEFWNKEKIFEQSVSSRNGKPEFTFYEGPPSANGTPGIHHVMARTVKDIFCRYKTLRGFQVKRKGGWDTHGLPVELQVEKMLGITKDDIGKSISIEEYNRKCRDTVMMYKDQWDTLTQKMGYWVDLNNPYITYDSNYIESIWWLLKMLYDRKLLYKGYTIQPFSPAAGTGLSSHELNLPGCYKEVKDTSVVAQFKSIRNDRSEFLFEGNSGEVYLLAWTTTPWTLPSNTALVIGEKIRYVQVNTYNPYTHKPVSVVLAKDLLEKYFSSKNAAIALDEYKPGDKNIPFKVIREFSGHQLTGIQYEQLLPWLQPLYDANKAFSVLAGDFVTTEDGTGIVHSSPTFGSDDFRISKMNGTPPLTVRDAEGNEVPTVDRQGKFVEAIGKKIREGISRYNIRTHLPDGSTEFFVKNYRGEDEGNPDYKSTDVILSIILKEENKAFRVEKYEHSYPHCWRTDKPVLYYPLDSWFIRTTACKDKLVELNKTINWKPESTGTGRFGNWLENLVDWNLSRSRYWGTPLPIWRTEDGSEEICIGSIAELKNGVARAEAAGIKQKLSTSNWPEKIDLHRPIVDEIILVGKSGKPMHREPDLIDVWFDSGAMPYAQHHWPFEGQDASKADIPFPADYISEGVDQTRGWFFTLHAIAGMLFDSVAFKNVISTGLVLDKNGNKMSKRLGNVVNPFEALDKYGPDPVRWYMIENAPPWDNLKFNMDGVTESQRRFFGTLFNTYSFFALYANIDGFVKDEQKVLPASNLSVLDRWILSRLQNLIREVTAAYEDYDPTRAARAIQEFVNDQLSNWYVRLNRKRFWQPGQQGALSEDKRAAYETLFECLAVVAQLMSPVAPFFADWLYRNLTGNIRAAALKNSTPFSTESVHLTSWTTAEASRMDQELEISMDYAQRICSLVHSIRKNSKIKVRTPLGKILLPITDHRFAARVKAVEEIILAEVNVKSIEYIDDASGLLIKKVKPNFAKLGKQYGPKMKDVAAVIQQITKEEIAVLEKTGQLQKGDLTLVPDDVIISSEDIPGWSVAGDGSVTVALDITVTDALRREGIARDLVNRIQNVRKDSGFDVLDKISIVIENPEIGIASAIEEFRGYICTETQAIKLAFTDQLAEATEIDMDEFKLRVHIKTI
ncbi:MAG: isoleucine--tRNA ligase [Bacteroidetes bacterium]|nr:isoleucine--tRNA ligase [Bacteroidota bacterium]